MQIPLNQFEQYIDEIILARGLSYFKNGRVNEPEEITPGVYESIVEGTEDYIVHLSIKDGNIVEYACNCPYDLGPICKHVVAVIFYLQQEESELKKKSPISKSTPQKEPLNRKTIADQVNELLESISHDELKQFVREKTEQNLPFRNLFLSSFAQYNKDESKELYQKQVKSILRSTSDRHGFINWSASHQVGNEVADLLVSAQKQFENQNYKSSFFICTAVMEQMTEALQYADDSNGDIGNSIDFAFEILYKIVQEKLPEEIRKIILDYCISAFDRQIYLGWDWHLDMLQIASELLKTDEETQHVLNQIDKAQGSEYEKEKAQSIKYNILKKTKGEKEADKYLEQNLSNSRFRGEAISKALKNKNYDKAITLAREGVNHDKKEKPGLAMEWYDWLLKIAQAQNDKVKIIEYSRLLFVNNFRHEQDYYRILKQNFPAEEWNTFIKEVIQDITKRNRWLDSELIAGIYIKEEWWDNLLELVKNSPSLRTIEHYEKYLSKDYSDELVHLYSEAIMKYLKDNLGRKHYQNACRYLKRIIKLGAREKANKIIKMLRTEYPQRRALMEELSQI